MFYYYSEEERVASGSYQTLAVSDRVVVAETGRLIADVGRIFELLGSNRISVAGSLVSGTSAIVGDATSGSNEIRILEGGSVIGGTGFAITLSGSLNSVFNAGWIDGAGGIALVGSDSYLVNSGDIVTTGAAVQLGQSGNTGAVTFNNSGYIAASNASNAVELRGNSAFNMVNSGTIVGSRSNAIDLTGAGGSLTLANSGTIQAKAIAIYTDGGADTVYNTGTIVGEIRLLGGDDTYVGTGGIHLGSLDGGSGNDLLIGGDSRDRFEGSFGDDEIDGAGGNDVLSGEAGSDTIDGGDGNDVLIGGSEGDALDGGAGRDVASYRDANSEVLVDLADTSLNTGDAEGDTYVGIEVFQGGQGDDQLLGTAAADTLQGGEGGDTLSGRDGNDLLQGQIGDDMLVGGLGNDRLQGGLGSDTASYVGATGLVRVNLSLVGSQNTTSAGRDTLVGIENLIGSAFADVLAGDSIDNAIDGGDGGDQISGDNGDDLLTGGLGDDRITGGLGLDTASYAAATAAITLNLSILTAQATGGAGSDTVFEIENITGSAFGDVLTGSTLANVLDGGAGNDQLVGGDGDDRLAGGAGNDVLTGGIGVDTADYTNAEAAVRIKLVTTTAQNTFGAGTDTLTGIESLIGSAFNDNLAGDGLANTLEGGDGNDILNGGGAVDTASYRNARGSVTVDLATTAAQDTLGAGTDELSLIEGLIGSAFNDILNGNAGNNRIDGLSGADDLTGFAGNDTLIGGDGDDRLFGGDDSDTLFGGDGDNLLDGGAGIDTVNYADAANGLIVVFNVANPYAFDFAFINDTLVSIDAVIGSRFADRFEAGAGIQRYTGGLGADQYAFDIGTAEGDTIVGFSGTGGEGDKLYFYGYGVGASFVQLDATRWYVRDAEATIAETITFAGGSLIVPATDVIFG